ncbi:MAG: purine-nucleoside phosphorylase [Candidatus Limnocylindrales bacterium]
MPELPVPFSQRLDELEARVREVSTLVPHLGMVLGSGLGGLADEIEDRIEIPFEEMPGWPAATVPGHSGKLILGELRGLPVACLRGRLHMYEGLSERLVVEPVLLLGRLGAPVVLLTNASGGVNPAFGSGTLMVMRDHINLTGRNPLTGPNDDVLGPRFPDMTEVWNEELRDRLHAAGRAEDVPLAEGVYLGLTGPTYETPAEVRMLRTLGADAVGMSTVMEAVAANWAGSRVCGVSLVTNAGAGLSPTPLTHAEVVEAADAAGPRLARVIGRFAEGLHTAR